MTMGRLCLAIVLINGCAHPAPPPLLSGSIRSELWLTLPMRRPSPQSLRARIVARARGLLDGAPLKAGEVVLESDPVGFARAAYWAAGIELFDSDVASDPDAHAMEILFRSAAERRALHSVTPKPADLVFFDASSAKSALYPSQVAVVEGVSADGTFTALGLFAGGPERIVVNLRAPGKTHDEGGARINDTLAGDGAVVAAQLFRAFAHACQACDPS